MSLAVEREGFKVGTCKLCGQPIVWAENKTGDGKIPLDAKAPTYATKLEGWGPEARRFMHNSAGDMILVSHFSTCPAKTRAYELLRQCARMFRQTGFGVYPTNQEAGELMRRVHEHLRMDGP